jgi:hypothetical protein
VSLASAVPMQRMLAVLARLQQSIGWAGIAGLGLIVAAAVVLASAWSTQTTFVRAATAGVPVTPARAHSTAPIDTVAQVSPDLPPLADIPLLLTQIRHAAVSNGLDWRAAEYRIVPATSTQPASLEVRCGIKGPYPKLRSMLVQLKAAIPAFTIRELSASRANADTPDIDAKLALAVFVQDGSLGSDTSAAEMALPTTPRTLP